MNNLTQLTASQLRQAADLQEKIVSLNAELDQILGVSTPNQKLGNHAKPLSVSANKTTNKRPKISAAARTRLSAIAKARWKRAKAAGRKAL